MIEIDQSINLKKIRSDLIMATIFASVLSLIIIVFLYIGNVNYEGLFLIFVGVVIEFLIILIFIIRRQRQLKNQKMFFIETIDEKLTLKKSDEIGYDEQCKICKINLEPNQDIVNCPKCDSIFHLEHLQNWLKVKFHCPICQYDFKELYTEEEVEID
ncbi:MAG: E3 ubiquitin protein ligase [Asgard group archaeon]|nr:E3 ubiquitin protein ligase [Asgard group archaeon]